MPKLFQRPCMELEMRANLLRVPFLPKDAASAAVMVLMILAGLVWTVVVAGKLAT